METVRYFEEKKVSAYGTLEKLKAANATEDEIEEAGIMARFWEAMEQEAGEDLGVLLYEFATLVNFDSKLLKPIANKDAGFWTDVESMGYLDFNIKRLELERQSVIISLLQSIDITLKSFLSKKDAKPVRIKVTEKEPFYAGSLINRNPEELKEAGIKSDELGNLTVEDEFDFSDVING